MLRGVAALCACLLPMTGSIVPAASAAPQPATSPAPSGPVLVVEGAGAAHGMGLAMDGVLGQAKAGWPHRKILGLFYPGAKPGSAGGTVRVGLAEGAEHSVQLPSGGVLSDGGTGRAFPVALPPGSRVSVSYDDGTYTVRLPGLVRGAQAPSPPVNVPTPPAPPAPTASPDPSPTPRSSPTPAPPSGGALQSRRSIWISPAGEPALVKLDATGRRYRGRMEIRYSESGGGLWAINHVDLETYVAGIAEEKGAGWPVEGLKVLAVAARSLAAATMDWYARHHANGFDICPTGSCQVYLGFDGEEPAMTKATRETAGQILTHQGRPILAMYHGNGAGRTESYRLLYGNGRDDPYPYLASVAYPHANPRRWSYAFTTQEAEAALRAKGVTIEGRLQRVDVLERGHSPRVRRVGIVGSGGITEISGLALQGALGLPSAWFDVRRSEVAPPDVVAADPSASGASLRLAIRPFVPIRRGPAPEAAPLELIALAALLAATALMGAERAGRSSPRRSRSRT